MWWMDGIGATGARLADYIGDAYLDRTEVLTVIIVAGALALLVAAAVIVRAFRNKRPRLDTDSCIECGSMNVQNRAGLAICMDCGHSVRLTEVEAH